MPPYLSLYITGPEYPVAHYKFPSKDVYSSWIGMVEDVKKHAADGVAASEENKWTNGQVIANMMEWFEKVREMQRQFGKEMIPPDIVYAARNNNGHLVTFGHPTVDVPCSVNPQPPMQMGCKLIGLYDPKFFQQNKSQK